MGICRTIRPQLTYRLYGEKETDMTRYIVTATRTLYGYETVFSFSNEADAKAKMEKLDADIRYTYTYRVEGGEK